MSPFFKKVYDAFRRAVNREIAQIYLDDFALNRSTKCVVQLFQTWRHGICRKHAAVMEGRLSIKCMRGAVQLLSATSSWTKPTKTERHDESLHARNSIWQEVCMCVCVACNRPTEESNQTCQKQTCRNTRNEESCLQDRIVVEGSAKVTNANYAAPIVSFHVGPKPPEQQ